MKNEIKTPKELYEGEDRLVYHAEVKGDAHGINILSQLLNEKLKNYYSGSADDHFDDDELCLYSPSKFYSKYDHISELCWTIVYTSDNVLHFFCNDLVNGNNAMIETLFGKREAFYDCQNHFQIKEKLSSEPDEIEPFMYFISIYYISTLPHDDWTIERLPLTGETLNNIKTYNPTFINPNDFKEIPANEKMDLFGDIDSNDLITISHENSEDTGDKSITLNVTVHFYKINNSISYKKLSSNEELYLRYAYQTELFKKLDMKNIELQISDEEFFDWKKVIGGNVIDNMFWSYEAIPSRSWSFNFEAPDTDQIAV